MKFRRLEFGKIAFNQRPKISDYFKFGIDRTSCGCVIFTLSIFYFTIFNKECIQVKMESDK